jgi:hypothetical protein
VLIAGDKVLHGTTSKKAVSSTALGSGLVSASGQISTMVVVETGRKPRRRKKKDIFFLTEVLAEEVDEDAVSSFDRMKYAAVKLTGR